MTVDDMNDLVGVTVLAEDPEEYATIVSTDGYDPPSRKIKIGDVFVVESTTVEDNSLCVGLATVGWNKGSVYLSRYKLVVDDRAHFFSIFQPLS